MTDRQTDRETERQTTVDQKMQFAHTVNGDGSKTAKIIKGTITHTNIACMSMLVWLIMPFLIFAVNSVYKLQFF